MSKYRIITNGFKYAAQKWINSPEIPEESEVEIIDKKFLGITYGKKEVKNLIQEYVPAISDWGDLYCSWSVNYFQIDKKPMWKEKIDECKYYIYKDMIKNKKDYEEVWNSEEGFTKEEWDKLREEYESE